MPKMIQEHRIEKDMSNCTVTHGIVAYVKHDYLEYGVKVNLDFVITRSDRESFVEELTKLVNEFAI